jgi:hypothetical protein
MFQLRLPATMPVCCCTVAKFDQTGQSLMTSQTSVGTALAHNILDRVETLLLEAEEALKPLELDPYRSRLFELFVMADAAGFLDEDAAPDLTSDGIARELSERWNLADAARSSIEQQSKLPRAHLSKMRQLWSFMRMWMEWTYAWNRWHEFHDSRSYQSKL